MTLPGRAAAYDLVTFGETMVRLTVAGGRRLEEAGTLEVTIGGTESNVAVALARLGRRVAWLSALPDNALGRRIERELRGHGVDTSRVLWTEGRAGVYFLEPGATPRPTRVLYDRAGSALAALDPEALDPGALDGARALHLTGITPALSPGCAAACLRLAVAAGERGVPVILDVNYRARLWTPEQAAAGLAPLLERAGVILCGAGDAATIWGLRGQPENVAAGLLERSAAALVIVTLREAGALARARGGAVFGQPAIPVATIDPVGAGDAFAAGFLHRWLDDRDDVASALRTAAALAAIKMTLHGDHARALSPDELAAAEALLDRPADIDR